MAAAKAARGPRAASKSVAKSSKRKKPAVRMLAQARVAGAVAAFAAATGTARFGAGKLLAVTAEKDPARVYPHFDVIAGLLGSASKVVRWNALQILGALAPVDKARKLDGVLDCYLGFVQCGNLISAANALQGAGRIAAARPELGDRIVPAILAAEQASYETAECRNVAIGRALDVLMEIWPAVCGRRDVRAFVVRQQSNPRAAVARRAAELARR